MLTVGCLLALLVQPHQTSRSGTLTGASHRKASPVDCYAGTNLYAVNLSRWELYPDAPEVVPLVNIYHRSLALHNACSRQMLSNACHKVLIALSICCGGCQHCCDKHQHTDAYL